MSEPLNRDAIYVKLYYAPTELLRGEPQGGRTERTLVDYSDMKDVHKEYLDQRARIAALEQEVNNYAWLCGKAQDERFVAQAQLATLTAERDRLREEHLATIAALRKLWNELAALRGEPGELLDSGRDEYGDEADEAALRGEGG